MQIRQLTVENFRGIESLTWKPSPGFNCLIGPGDVGKSTILDAISLLFAPYSINDASELDYRDRHIEREFRIEAVCAAARDSELISQRNIIPLRGWLDGKLTDLPDVDGAEPVFVCQIIGDRFQDLIYSITPLDGEPFPFPVGLRQALTLVRIAGADRADRDLRLGRSSLLNRYFGGPALGSELTTAVQRASDTMETPSEIDAKRKTLCNSFKAAGLPHNLQFSLLPSIGYRLSGMVSLSVGQEPSTAIPFSNSGAGTRNLTLMELSASLATENPLVIVDEPERGLEPYRQRQLGKRLCALIGKSGQGFATTHSPFLLHALRKQNLWRLNTANRICAIDMNVLGPIVASKPSAFLSHLPIICEGPTEIGFLRHWLPRKLNLDLDSRGLELVDGNGQPAAIQTLKALHAASISCAGFLDNEQKFSGSRKSLSQAICCFTWDDCKDIEDALATHLTIKQLQKLIAFASELSKVSTTTYLTQIRDALNDSLDTNITSTDFSAIIAPVGQVEFRTALSNVMSKNSWFKTEEKGESLASFLEKIGLPESIDNQIDKFVAELKTVHSL